MIELTLARTKELLAEAVAEKGADFVYTNRDGHAVSDDGSVPCHYVHGDQPGCIVGYVLHKAGVPLQALLEVEHSPADMAVGGLYDAMRAEDGVKRLLTEVQRRQDRGKSWGEALRLGLAAVGA